MFPLIVPEDAVTFPFALNTTLYVVPLQIALLTVNKGATVFGAAIVIICGLHPAIVEVIVTEVPEGMLVILVAPTVPAEAVIVAPFGLLILML